MTTSPTHAVIKAQTLEVEAAIAENVNTLLHRSRMTASALAGELSMSKATLSRKMLGGPWHYTEVLEIALFFGVSTDELANTLPSREELRARRDSNPKPSDP